MKLCVCIEDAIHTVTGEGRDQQRIVIGGDQRLILASGGEQRIILANPAGGGVSEQRILLAPSAGGEQRILVAPSAAATAAGMIFSFVYFTRNFR